MVSLRCGTTHARAPWCPRGSARPRPGARAGARAAPRCTFCEVAQARHGTPVRRRRTQPPTARPKRWGCQGRRPAGHTHTRVVLTARQVVEDQLMRRTEHGQIRCQAVRLRVGDRRERGLEYHLSADAIHACMSCSAIEFPARGPLIPYAAAPSARGRLSRGVGLCNPCGPCEPLNSETCQAALSRLRVGPRAEPTHVGLGMFISRFLAFIFIFYLPILGIYRDEIRHVSSRIAGIYRDEIRYLGLRGKIFSARCARSHNSQQW